MSTMNDDESDYFLRDEQEADTIYEMPDGSVFYTPDGIGRVYYDTIEDALADMGDDAPVISPDRDIAPWD